MLVDHFVQFKSPGYNRLPLVLKNHTILVQMYFLEVLSDLSID